MEVFLCLLFEWKLSVTGKRPTNVLTSELNSYFEISLFYFP
ncbi:hypothetical protein VCR29J2_680126 [Vibrio coralliirubri]|nr:hypothetical protein VCR29J2_680126 [Vibrio coralliirubri]